MICRQAGITEINGAITMIYATIPNTSDKVKFTVLNYYHEKLGGRKKSKDCQFANLSVRQHAKIHLLYLKIKDTAQMGLSILLPIHWGRTGSSKKQMTKM